MSARGRPNYLLISVDDMNPWLGCLRDQPWCHPQVITPHLDRLAAGGTVFTHAHTPAPLCNPARTAIMTGLHPTTSGVYGNHCWWRPHLPDVRTLPELSRENGYVAAGAGKVFHHCAGFNPPEQWNDFQIQRFDDLWDRQSRVNYPDLTPTPPPAGHPFSGLDTFMHEFDWGVLPIGESAYGDQDAATYGVDFLGRAHARPFLLACGLFHPHLPWYAPQRYFDLYDPAQLRPATEPESEDGAKIPVAGKALAAVGPQDREQMQILRRADAEVAARHAYLANISFTDAMVGRVLEALAASDYAENTVVVFYGDHGFHIGEKNHFGKRTLWRESTQVPLIVSGPGVAAGRRVDAAVSTLGLRATLAELAGWEETGTNAVSDSRSWVPYLGGGAVAEEAAVTCSLDEGNHAVVTRRHRYIRYADGGEELYDLQRDALERHNLAGEPGAGEIMARLRREIPDTPTPAGPGLEAYAFDRQAYRWTRRE